MKSHFIENFNNIQQVIYNSEFVKKIIDNLNITPAEQTQFLAQFMQISLNGAVELEKIELENRQLKIAEEKHKVELELLIEKARQENKALQINTLKELVQAQSMLRSVVDNAKISKANAFVALMNIMGNATNTSGIVSYIDLATRIINSIDSTPLEGYNDIMNLIQDTIKNLIFSDNGRKVFISALRSQVAMGESLRIQGFTILSNAASKFRIQETDTPAREQEGHVMYFIPSKIGAVDISFLVQEGGAWISDTIRIYATEPKVEQIPLSLT